MPQFTAIEGLQVLHESGLNLPYIVISGSIGEELAVEAMKAGANDYMMKNNLSRLCPAIKREIREAENQRKSKLAEKALEESEERYRTFINSTSDLVFLKDSEFKYLVLNKAMEISMVNHMRKS